LLPKDFKAWSRLIPAGLSFHGLYACEKNSFWKDKKKKYFIVFVDHQKKIK